jgi:hypothetical protein
MRRLGLTTKPRPPSIEDFSLSMVCILFPRSLVLIIADVSSKSTMPQLNTMHIMTITLTASDRP